ncbi:carboxypeptidase-like regulatory domain-containing protein [Fodinibius sp. AD559]|uniref:carboxypeptidase-like regulatory domain-containing protein n=1 Tax=Fodinibius sp. AD559 TaxID=3424179 RepID=UPI004046C612
MKFATTLIFLILFQNISIAQSSFTIEGIVVHAESKNPIPLVSIGIPDLNIGTATRMDGSFSLNLSQKLQKDTLQVSAIGYQTKKYTIPSIKNNNDITIYLAPKIYQMESITVTDRNKKTKWIGKKIPPIFSASLGIWTHPERLGAAFAFKINWEKQLPLQILYSRIFLKRNTNTSVHIRCGLTEVNYETGMPAQPLIPKTINITTTTQKGWATCDFRNQDLYMDSEEFFVVFEWLTPQDERIIPMIATNPFFESDTYIRHHSLAEWKKSSTDLIYSVKVEY